MWQCLLFTIFTKYSIIYMLKRGYKYERSRNRKESEKSNR